MKLNLSDPQELATNAASLHKMISSGIRIKMYSYLHFDSIRFEFLSETELSNLESFLRQIPDVCLTDLLLSFFDRPSTCSVEEINFIKRFKDSLVNIRSSPKKPEVSESIKTETKKVLTAHSVIVPNVLPTVKSGKIPKGNILKPKIKKAIVIKSNLQFGEIVV